MWVFGLGRRDESRSGMHWRPGTLSVWTMGIICVGVCWVDKELDGVPADPWLEVSDIGDDDEEAVKSDSTMYIL